MMFGQATGVTAEAVANRKRIASGDISSIYSVEQENGKTKTTVESQYFGIAEKFIKAHDELKTDFDSRLTMLAMSTDLALIDATRGKNFTNGSEKIRTSLLEDHSSLKARLDSPSTPLAEKRLISDYFDAMGGTALTFLENRYDSRLAKGNNDEQREDSGTKERLSHALEELKEELNKAKDIFLEDSSLFASALSNMDELVSGRSTNLDKLRFGLAKLMRAQESLAHSAGGFSQANADYLLALVQNEEQFGDRIYSQELDDVEDNNEQIQLASRRIHDVDDYVARLKTYIGRIEDLMAEMGRF